jgi:hypothetical protein
MDLLPNTKQVTTSEMLKLIKKEVKPRKPRATKAKDILPLTFGKLIDESEASKYYGFLYCVYIPHGFRKRRYYGIKSFRSGSDWTTYTTSSKIVQRMINGGMQAEYKVLGFYRTKQELEAAEAASIAKFWHECRECNCRELSLNYNIAGKRRWKQ